MYLKLVMSCNNINDNNFKEFPNAFLLKKKVLREDLKVGSDIICLISIGSFIVWLL